MRSQRAGHHLVAEQQQILELIIGHMLNRQYVYRVQKSKQYRKKSSVLSCSIRGPFQLSFPPLSLTARVRACSVTQSCVTLWPHGLQPAKLLCPSHSPGKNTGMGCHFLLQGIFPAQGSNPRLLHISCIAGEFFTTEPPGKPLSLGKNHLNSFSQILYVSLRKYKQMVCPLPFTSRGILESCLFH